MFTGTGANGQSGLFAFDGTALATVVSFPTSLPIGAGETFTLVDGTPPSPCTIRNANVAFIASGPFGFQGVYLSMGIGGPLVNLASSFTTIPNTTLTFHSFGSVSYDGTFAAFVGSAAQVADAPAYFAVCKVTPAPPLAPPSPCLVVADTATPVPSGIGAFLGFGTVVVDPGGVVFEGFSSDGAGRTRSGLYTDLGGRLSKVLADGDIVNGKNRAIAVLRVGRLRRVAGRTRGDVHRCDAGHRASGNRACRGSISARAASGARTDPDVVFSRHMTIAGVLIEA
jgi:hypothetical protein